MSRTLLPFSAPDLSSFVRALGAGLKTRHADHPEPPGHVELLNLVARALGHRNVQALRVALSRTTPQTAALPAGPLAVEDRPLPAPLSTNARKALTQFDSRGRLVRWPHKLSVQRLAMWVLWTQFESRRVYTEREVNAILRERNTFDDHVTLRRELINHGLLTRKSDCSEYRKLPARADEETRALLAAWRARQRAAATPRRAPAARAQG